MADDRTREAEPREPNVPGFEIPPGPGGGGSSDGGGGSSSGGSSSSGSSTSSGGSSGPSEAEQRINAMVSTFDRAYFGLWGVLPPPGYSERHIKNGMNIHEFEQFEKSKPAWWNTPQSKKETEPFVKLLKMLMGLA